MKPRLARDPAPAALRADTERLARLMSPGGGLAFERQPLGASVDQENQAAARPSSPALAWARDGGPTTPTKGALLYLHGGGYVFGSPETHRGLIGALTKALPGVEIGALDYRLAPEHPFPAAFDDALAAWEAIRGRGLAPEHIALAGDSAGGGLALALSAALSARNERPAAVAAFSPLTDLALTGASLNRNARREAMLPLEWLERSVKRYLAGADPHDPRASPLYAAFQRPPPVLIQVGSTEALKDDSLRMVETLRRAGGDVRLELLRDAPHVVQIFERFLPEGAAALRSAAAFLRERLAAAAKAP